MRSGLRVLLAFVAFGVAGVGRVAGAQAPDPSARLNAVLPADVAARVIARIAEARSRALPADALEKRALKFAAKGVAAKDIEKSVFDQADRMADVDASLKAVRGQKPAGDEVDAGADAMRKGVDAAGLRALARSAPSGRSLAVPFYVVGSLLDAGVPAGDALQRVQARLAAKDSDADLETLSAQAASGNAGKPALTGRDLAATKRAGAMGHAGGGPPAGVPANGGARARPVTPGKGRRP